MNNKGQTLVIFVILLPFLFVFIGYVVEKCDLLYQEKNQKELSEMVCKYALNKEHNQDQIKKLVLENDEQIEKVEVFYHQEEVQIILTKQKKSIFAKIIGKDSFLIKTTTNCTE